MPTLTDSYRRLVAGLLDSLTADADGNLTAAARAVATALAADRIIHVAGTGHSHMLAEEVFYRAGGIAAAQAILEPTLMLHLGARASSDAERREGFAAEVIARYGVQPGDVVIIASNSGRNAYPIDMALAARACGAVTIAITSADTARQVTARHSSGKLLCDLADIVIDNCVPAGDAALPVPGHDQPMGPLSTIAGVFILNALLAEAVAALAAAGHQVDVYQSANGPTNSQTAPEIAARWQARIKGL